MNAQDIKAEAIKELSTNLNLTEEQTKRYRNIIKECNELIEKEPSTFVKIGQRVGKVQIN